MSLQGALQAWRAVIGSDHVVTEGDALAAAERATFATHQRVPAIIRPASCEDVRDCVRIAASQRISLHAVSTGCNWGFGSRVPERSGTVLLELHRMNRIRDYDEELAYVTVEPGVTFAAIHSFLRDRGSRLAVPFTGSSPDSSVIGNTLDRGDGIGRNGYRAHQTCGLEVVLPDGDCIRSGVAAFEGAAAAPAYRGGPGPEIDGLFCQSSLGVVTAMTLWLTPIPRTPQLCYFAVNDAARLGGLVDAIREMLLNGIFSPVVSVRNDYFMLLARQRRYPWEALGERAPFPPSIVERTNRLFGRRSWWSAAWAGFAWLDGASQRHAAALQEVVVDVLSARTDRLVFIGDGETTASKWDSTEDLTPADLQGLSASELRLGERGQDNVAAAYWRKRSVPAGDLDPDRDGCGVIFLTPIVPLRATELTACTQMLRDTMLDYDFEPFMNVFAIQERCAYVAAMLLYDRDVEGEDDRARACHDKMLVTALNRGWIPHRIAAGSASLVAAAQPLHRPLLDAIKDALDPHDVLGPGRYP